MTLTRKDLMATLLVAAAGLVTFAQLQGFDWPLPGGWRLASLAVVLLGMAACTAGASPSSATSNGDGWRSAATVMGSLAFVAGAVGIIFNSKAACLLLMADIVALWTVTTMYHLARGHGRGHTAALAR